MCHGGISQRAGARGEMSSRMAGADRTTRGGSCFHLLMWAGAVSHLPNSLDRCKEHLPKQIHADVVPGEWFGGAPWV